MVFGSGREPGGLVETLPDAVDVIVAGSGAAALTAALAAASRGLSVLVAEKTMMLGGTSAMSGGGVWVPANHHAAAAGLPDSPAEALAYLRAAAPEGWAVAEDHLWEALCTNAPRMLRLVEERSPLRFRLVEEGDPLPDLVGAKARGRMVSPRPLSGARRSALGRRIRATTHPHLFTYEETIRSELHRHPIRAALTLAPVLAWRWLAGRRAQGTALIAGLLAGCRAAGCTIAVDATVATLTRDSTNRIDGAEIEHRGRRQRVAASCGVVLATGGFEWDAPRLRHHFCEPIGFIASPVGNSGDGHRMAEEVGAVLAHMDQANISPVIPSHYEGRPHGMALFYHRAANAILVDGSGRRFVDETTFNLGEILDRRDASGVPLHRPVWIITDSRFLRRAPLVRWYARPRSDWLVKAGDVAELAARIGIPAATLSESVARFNEDAASGRDRDHGRSRDRAPGLEPIDRPPYVAISFNRSFLGTKGGPRTDASGAVLGSDGTVIAGLYCCGGTMANPIGTRAVGAGTTLGPYMTFGYICGMSIGSR